MRPCLPPRPRAASHLPVGLLCQRLFTPLAWLGLLPLKLVQGLLALACVWLVLPLRRGWCRLVYLPMFPVAVLILVSVLALSACGTAPLPATTCPPVPAALMTPPAPPVPLGPTSALPPPGATTPPTLPAARKTARVTSI